MRVSVPPDDPVKVCKLTLRNTSRQPQKTLRHLLRRAVLGVSREISSRYVITQADRRAGGLFARNPYNNEFAERVAFATTGARSFTFTADRAEFLGRNGSTRLPPP